MLNAHTIGMIASHFSTWLLFTYLCLRFVPFLSSKNHLELQWLFFHLPWWPKDKDNNMSNKRSTMKNNLITSNEISMYSILWHTSSASPASMFRYSWKPWILAWYVLLSMISAPASNQLYKSKKQILLTLPT